MTRFVVDAATVIQLASEHIEVDPAHELLAPTLTRSQTLTMLHEGVVRDDVRADDAVVWSIRSIAQARLGRR